MTTSDDDEDTETKLAILASIFTKAPQDTLFDILIRAEGKIPEAVELFLDETPSAAPFGPPAKRRKTSEETNNDEAKSDAVQRLKWTDSAEPARKVQIPPLCGDSSRCRSNIKLCTSTNQTKSLP
jgi:hypothetical protein